MTRLAALALCFATALTGPAMASDDTPPRPVKLLTVAPAEAGMTREFYGRVVARQTVDLAFQTGGQLIEFPLIEGEPIAKGDLVARLDPEPLELAVEQARLRREQAARDLNRLLQLSRATVSEAAQQDARTAEGLAAVAQRDAERALSHATLTAPFDALVAERLVANFTTVAAGTPVVRLHDMSELRVEVEVPEILFQRAGNDKDIQLEARFLGHADSYPLEIREFTTDATQSLQSFKVTMAFPEDRAPEVLPGSSVTVRALLAQRATGLPVPSSALVPAADGSITVMLFDESNEGAHVRARTVEIEVADDGSFRVTEGLKPGDVIVAAGASALENGQAVRRFTGFPQ